jgi:hypothetical protein
MSMFALSNFEPTPLSFLPSGIIARTNVTLLFTLGGAVMAIAAARSDELEDTAWSAGHFLTNGGRLV